jgi:hypothetical protein
VITTDADALIRYLNPTAEIMTGCAVTDAVCMPLHEVFNMVNEELRKTLESQSQVETAFSMLKRNLGSVLCARSYWHRNRD